MRHSPRPAPAPVAIFRPDAQGALVHVETVQPTKYRPWDNGYTNDREVIRFRLIAIQETGEEMFAGYASTRNQALARKYAWLDAHPEHRDVIIEKV